MSATTTLQIATPSTLVPNGGALRRADVPEMAVDALERWIRERLAAGGSLAALFAIPSADGEAADLHVAIAKPHRAAIAVARARIGARWPSLTRTIPQAHLFERAIAERTGSIPEGHPWLKPVRFARSWTGRDAWGRKPADPIRPAVWPTFRMEGEEVHEVAVGPVHAGVIEPGHFRFQCHGEIVHHLEILLGFQHRGIEKGLVGGPDKTTLHRIETAAGDTTIAHATAHAEALEALAGVEAPPRARWIRAIALELERLANHAGDLGALSGDVGYLPTASFCGRIRGDFLNATALICGSRFGRGIVRAGGAGFDLDRQRASDLLARVEAAMRDATGAVELMFDSATVRDRFEGVGVVSREVAAALGMVGPAARACGIATDVRAQLPSGAWRDAKIEPATADGGDVMARALVRFREMQASVEWLRAALESGPPAGELRAKPGPLAADSIAIAMTEGWRGRVTHVVLTDAASRFAACEIVDPSFLNWMGLAMALRGQQVSDFPLCNKSFNLSYCGHDL